MTSATSVSSTHNYHGNSDINFCLDEQDGLSVTIDTERLHLRSVLATEQEYDSYAALFGDEDVMCKYQSGVKKNREDMVSRINDTWVKRWHGNDPYSAFAVFKRDTDDFLGHINLGHGDVAGESEVAYLFMKNCWRQGFGTESVTAVVQEYAPATVQEGYLLDGKALVKVLATARPDNPGSCVILETVGMQLIGKEEKYGALRHCYALELKDIPKTIERG